MNKTEFIELLRSNDINPLFFTVTANANRSLSVRAEPRFDSRRGETINYLNRRLQTVDGLNFTMYRKTIVIHSNN